MPQSDGIASGFGAVGADIKSLLARVAALENAVFQADRTPVYVIWGQSQAQGQAPIADLPSILSGARTDKIWNGSAFVALQAQTQAGYPQAANHWGAEMLLSKLAHDFHARDVYIVKHAIGNTGLTLNPGPGTWDPDVRGGLFDTAMAELDEALTLMTNQGLKPLVMGFIWAQGEADSKANNQAVYATKLEKIFKTVRSRIGRQNLPILDMLIRSEYSEYTNTAETNAAKASVASSLGNVKLLKTMSFEDKGDDVHYNGAGYLAFGRHAFEYFNARLYPLPSGLPTLAFQFDASKQENFSIASLMRASQWNDLSPNGLHLLQATEANQPGVIEGPLGLGMGTMRFTQPRGFVGGVNPFAADSFFTLAYLVTNYANPTQNSVRTFVRSLGSGSWILFQSNNTAQDRLKLRLGSSNILLQSSQAAIAGPEIVLVTYGGTGGSFMRQNGVQTASASTAGTHAAGGNLAMGDLTSTGLIADIPIMLGFAGAVTVAQAQKIEGYIAQRFINSLPSSHPYYASMPT